MKLRLALAAAAFVSAGFALQPMPAEAGGHLRKHLHDLGARTAHLCPLNWFRHRHAEPAYKPAPAKVAYAKKAAVKAAPKPLK